MVKVFKILRYIGLYFVSFVLLTFGSAKLIGDQFILTNYIEHVPLKYVDDFNLAWAFFARSFAYSFIIGLLEVAAGSLILFHRTRLIGLLLAFGMYVNIVLVDILFNVTDAVVHASLELLIVTLLLFPYFKDLKTFLWDMGGRFKSVQEGVKKFYWVIPFSFIAAVIFLNIWFSGTNVFYDKINGTYEVGIVRNNESLQLERGPWTEDALMLFDFDKSFNLMANHKNNWGDFRMENDSIFLTFTKEFLNMKSVKGVFNEDKISATDDKGAHVIFHLKKITEAKRR